MPTPEPKYLLLGEVLRPHGIKGELRVRILTDYPERIAELEHVYLASDPDATEPKEYNVDGVRFHHEYALLTLKEIADRTQAELFRGLFVMVDIDDAIPLDDDEVYLFQLIGMRVETETGEILGDIIEVLETGANDVYIVDSAQYGELLIPVTPHTLISTDAETGRVVMRLPEGLV